MERYRSLTHLVILLNCIIICVLYADDINASTTPPEIVAGPIINPANGHIYYLLEQSTWTDAEAKAVEMGGHLVTVNDQAENEWIYNTFLPFAGLPGEKSQGDLWIGYTDIEVEGVWKWISGESSDFTNWTSIEPSGGIGENYGMIWGPCWQNPPYNYLVNIPGQWNDLANVDQISTNGVSPWGVVEITQTFFHEDFEDDISSDMWKIIIQNEATTAPWNITTHNGYLSISKTADNDITTAQQHLMGGIESLFLLDGDFSITVDFHLSDFPLSTPSGWNEANFYMACPLNEISFQILRFTTPSDQRLEGYYAISSGSWGIDPMVDNTMDGKFRIIREGSTMWAWIDRGDGFSLLGSRTSSDFLRPMSVSLCVSQVKPKSGYRPNTSIEVHYDNLDVIAETIIMPRALTLLIPNGEKNYTVGTTEKIIWQTEGIVSNVQLDYSTDNGSTWIPIITAENTGSYSWTIPNTPSSECLVKISDADDPSSNDVSDAPFSIIPFEIELMSPHGGEILLAGTEHEIQWSSNASSVLVELEYSTDGGMTWQQLSGQGVENSGQYSWIIPEEASEKCFVRVYDVSYPDRYSQNKTPFEIVTSTTHKSVYWHSTGHWYKAVSTPDPIWWEDARRIAEEEGGHLVTLTSQEENDFVFALTKDRPALWSYIPQVKYFSGPWIGAFQENGATEPDGGWFWVNDEGLLEYSRWLSGEPSNSGGREKYAQLYIPEGSVSSPWWNDQWGVPVYGFVIEYDSILSIPKSNLFCYSGREMDTTVRAIWQGTASVAEWFIENPDPNVLAISPTHGKSEAEGFNIYIAANTSRDLTTGDYHWEIPVCEKGSNALLGTVDLNLHMGIQINVPADFQTIQSAVDNASDGDTIVIQPDTYEENVLLKGKSLLLASSYPEDHEIVSNTVIRPTTPGSVVICEGSEGVRPIVEGLTITGGTYDIPEDGLVVRWTFDNGSAEDLSPNGYNGSLWGSPEWRPDEGIIGGAMAFDGKGGHVTVKREIAGDFTITFWVNTTNAGGSGTQWYSGSGLVDGEVDGGYDDFGTSLLGGRFAFGVGYPDTTILSISSINDGNWHHCAATRDSDGGAMRIYVDGVLEGMTAGPMGLRDGPDVLRIGALHPNWNYFKGMIDDVRVYDITLTQEQVQQVRANQDPGVLAVGHWSFDQTTGFVVPDVSGHGNDGFVSATPTFTSGILGGAASFDGNTGYIQLPEGLSEWSSGFSAVVWVYPTGTRQASRLFDFGNANMRDHILMARSSYSNDLFVSVITQTGTQETVTAEDAISFEKWQCFAMTINPTGDVDIYKNGIRIKEGHMTPPRNILRQENYIGKSGYARHQYFKGLIDEIAVYNRVLNEEELLQMYARGSGVWANGSPIAVQNCIMTGNSASVGGAIACSTGPIRNSLIFNNSAIEGSATYGCSGDITNCTITKNFATDDYVLAKCQGTITNSILWDNLPSLISNNNVTYTCSEYPLNGLGNISADPLFANVNTNDYHLRSAAWRWDPIAMDWVWDDDTSLCIDAGSPGYALLNEPITIPADPHNRIGRNIRINMGYYGGSFQASMAPYNWTLLCDLTNDGLVDVNDLLVFSSYWIEEGNRMPTDFDMNGSEDFLDFVFFASEWMQTSTRMSE